MGGHSAPNRGKTDEWLTPQPIIEALGPFDLDPCAPVTRPWPTAAQHYTIEDDGLTAPWNGFVWCNPPYGPETWKWLSKLADHRPGGLALIFARTETEGFHATVWRKATSVLFLAGRLHFHHVTGERAAFNAGAPSCIVAYGAEADERILRSGISGAFVRLNDHHHPQHPTLPRSTTP
jgi:DNA N-6-adenine-methyltransferase (Dam)